MHYPVLSAYWSFVACACLCAHYPAHSAGCLDVAPARAIRTRQLYRQVAAIMEPQPILLGMQTLRGPLLAQPQSRMWSAVRVLKGVESSRELYGHFSHNMAL